MHEVTIPFRGVDDRDVGTQEEYFKILQDEFASRYLSLLGVAATPDNKAVLLRCNPFEDCTIQSIWSADASAVASAVKIVPPLRERFAERDEAGGAQRQRKHKYSQAEPINGLSDPKIADELWAEFEKARLGGAGARESGHRAIGSGNGAGKLDDDIHERFKQELDTLKRKFILPFACERPPREPGDKPELMLWPSEGALDLHLPREYVSEVCEPIRLEPQHVRRMVAKWVDEYMPLELLTSRRDAGGLAEVRRHLKDPTVSRLVGLLAHLLYWLALAPNRPKGDVQLASSALQSVFVEVQSLWAQFEKSHRETKLGVSVTLPCAVLTFKRSVERCFEMQYSKLTSDAILHQTLIDRINTLMMRLFDPDCMYARFGKFDGTGKAICLSKKLDMMMAAKGQSHGKRLQGRTHRSTPLVRSVLGMGCGEETSSKVFDSRTRAMLHHGDGRGAAPVHDMVQPPRDKRRQQVLVGAAMRRLSSEDWPSPRHQGYAQVNSARASPKTLLLPTMASARREEVRARSARR